MFRLIGSLAKSIVLAAQHDPELVRVLQAHPRLVGFVRARFNWSHPLGLKLTVGAAIAVYLLVLFVSIAQHLTSSDPLVLADLRLISLVQMFRTQPFSSVMLFITYLGNWQIIVLGAVFLTIVLMQAGLLIWVIVLWVSIGGGELIVWSLKDLLGRPRPDLVNALLPAAGPSFPSGHAFVALSFYGLLAWYGVCWAQRLRTKALLGAVAALLIASIGFSRIYLGVHWPSDVLASYALGGAWLTVVITVHAIAVTSVVAQRSGPTRTVSPAIPAVLFLGWAAVLGTFFQTHPMPPTKLLVPPAPIVLAATNFPSNLFDVAPRFSEDIVGSPMEPINVVLVGSETDIDQAFRQAGWSATDKITLGTTMKLITAELRNQPYPEAPGTPSFWSGKPNQRGYERPTEANSVRERHHLHLWDTPFQVAGEPVWVGTVHLDTSATTPNGIRLPIHQIDPAVDVQRESLRVDLSASRCVTSQLDEVVTSPTLGKNGAGNTFFTDGKALVFFVKCK